MAQIIPIRDLIKLNEISEMCNQTSEPVFVTKNGHDELVIMSIKAYNENLALFEVLENIQEAEEELENGAELLDGREALTALRKKYAKRICV